MAPRSVRCRAGRSRAPPVSRASPRPASWARRAAGGSTPTRAAASSIARGRPSRRAQTSATSSPFRSVRAKSGRTARARATKRRTASDCASAGAAPRRGPRQGQRGHQEAVLPGDAQRRPAGGHHPQVRTGPQQARHLPRQVREEVLRVVQQQHPGRPPQAPPQAFAGGRAGRVRAGQPQCAGHRRQGMSRLGHRRQGHQPDTPGEVLRQAGGEGQRQARLAHPRRAQEGQQAHLRAQQLPAGGRQLPLPPHQRREGHGQGGRSGRGGREGPHGATSRRRARRLGGATHTHDSLPRYSWPAPGATCVLPLMLRSRPASRVERCPAPGRAAPPPSALPRRCS